MRLGSLVTMWFHTRTMGVRGHAPRIAFIKNGAIWCILSIPKACNYQPKNQQR